MSINTVTELAEIIRKVSASRSASEATVTTFAQAIQAASRNGDGRKLELLRYVNGMARRLGITLPQNERIEHGWLNRQLSGESLDSRIAFKSALYACGLIAP